MAAQLILLLSESGAKDCLLACNEDVLTKWQLTNIITSNERVIIIIQLSQIPIYNGMIKCHKLTVQYDGHVFQEVNLTKHRGSGCA